MLSQTEIRPFRVGMPDEAIGDLRQRIAATRWPSRELVAIFPISNPTSQIEAVPADTIPRSRGKAVATRKADDLVQAVQAALWRPAYPDTVA